MLDGLRGIHGGLVLGRVVSGFQDLGAGAGPTGLGSWVLGVELTL